MKRQAPNLGDCNSCEEWPLATTMQQMGLMRSMQESTRQYMDMVLHKHVK